MSDLRQTVRRDDDLPPIARLLFAEIWQMNEACGECYAEDAWLGKQIGAAESTVRKHRLTLRQKGYIKQSKSGGRRYLEPNDVINIDQSDQQQSENISTADQSDQNRSDEVINIDQHRGSNNPEGTRERAREEGEAPVTMEEAVEVGQMVGVPKQLCREWWLHYDSKGWPFEVKSVSSALRKWKLNDQKFNGGSGGTPGGDGASRQLPDDDQDVIHFGSTR
jgi:biotin operon repressor